MPVFYNDEKRVLFVHIPKTGGTSVEDAMRVQGAQCLFSMRGLHPEQIKFLKCSPQHYHAEILEQLVCKERFNSIVHIIRDPVARLKSEYYWQLAQNQTTQEPLEWVESILGEYEADQFVADNHIRPQYQFLVRVGNEQLLRFEEGGVSNAIESISNFLDLQSKKYFLKLKFSQNRKMHRKMSNYDEKIEEKFSQIASSINKFYAEDKVLHDSL